MALLFLIIFMDDETKQMFLHRWRSKRRPLPWVFLNEKGTDRLKRFYSVKAACQMAGFYSTLLSDHARWFSARNGYTFGYNPRFREGEPGRGRLTTHGKHIENNLVPL
jgi:hypothetical protein